ncbi:MAG: hypothetical protein Alpg2KO_06530 [Alphaproteobacteria bacterium]
MSKITRLTRLARQQGVASPIDRPIDTGPRERWQHDRRRLVQRDEEGRVTAWAARRGSLDRMYDGKAITLPQWRAGRAFMQAWHDAALPPPVTQSYKPRMGDKRSRQQGSPERSDWQEKRYEDWRGAVRSVGKTSLSLLIRVICEDGTPSTMTELHQIKQALTRLTNYYGFD